MAHVLIVDDDEKIREMLHLLLEDAGYEVTEADNGVTALEVLRSTTESLVVLLDQQMPKMSGSELLGIVSKDSTLASRHAFIMITALGDRLRTPFSVVVLSKPFDMGVLLEVVAQTSRINQAIASYDEALIMQPADPIGIPSAWRTEPEIDLERKHFLDARRAFIANIELHLYPFAGISPALSRADIEWLLSTHESGGMRGPVDWSDPRQRGREGLDLRGTDMRGVNLSGLPLARTRGGLEVAEWMRASERARAAARMNLAGAHLADVHLEGAILRGGQFEHVELSQVHLEGADLGEAQCKHLRGAYLDGANLVRADLRGCDLREASLISASLESAHLEGAFLVDGKLQKAGLFGISARGCDFRNAHLEEAYLSQADLRKAHLEGAHLKSAMLQNVRLDGAYLAGADLTGADLSGAHLKGADLSGARMEHTIMSGMHAEQANLSQVTLIGADLRRAAFDAGTVLDAVVLGGPRLASAQIADVQWGGANLTVVNWEQVASIGDTQMAHKQATSGKRKTNHDASIAVYRAAVRANRQLAMVLRSQGINEDADRFAYQAQSLQRRLLWQQKHRGQWLFAMLLNTLAGYGYRLRRILFAYVLTLFVFSAVYYSLSLVQAPHLAWYQACLVSLTAIHGRVFFEQFGLNSILAWAAAVESVVGIVIEGVFVAMLVQRFFAR